MATIGFAKRQRPDAQGGFELVDVKDFEKIMKRALARQPFAAEAQFFGQFKMVAGEVADGVDRAHATNDGGGRQRQKRLDRVTHTAPFPRIRNLLEGVQK
ncbi:MAG TPA: hypothetical protein VKX17_06685 [Planctomycetota bacterium]|nr:hypothetical protein [Planctomycetota bacterium]